jgi:single-strand DNA-binding protein
MPGVNRATILGNVGNDPEIRSMASGDRVANLSIATSETWKDKQTQEKKEKTEWHRIVIWGPLVDVVEKYVHKGSKLYVEGKLQTRKWSDQSGVERYSTEIVLQGFGGVLQLLDGKPQGEGNQSRHQRPADQGDGYSGGGGYQQREDFSADLDDEIPF